MGRAKKTSKAFVSYKRLIAIRDNYFHCVASLRNFERLSDSDTLKSSMYEEYIRDVDRALVLLDPLDQKVINQEFFYQTNPIWWVGMFSKSTYYRLRRRAVETFLRNFYEQ